MGSPVVSATSTAVQSGNVTSHPITPPSSGATRGNLYLIVAAFDGNPTVTMPAGWTKLGQASNGTANTVAYFAKSVLPGDIGTSVTVTTSAAEASSMRAYRITKWSGTIADIKIGTAATGATNVPNAPNLNPPDWTTEDWTWIVAGSNDDGRRTLSSGVTNYTTDQLYQVSSAIAGGVGLYTGYRSTTAASEDPGTYQISTADEWVVNTIAILGSKKLAEEGFEGGTDGADLASTNTIFDLFNGIGTRKFASSAPPAHEGALRAQFLTASTNQALVKETGLLSISGGLAQRKQLWFRFYIRTPASGGTPSGWQRLFVIEESSANGGDDIAVIGMETSGALTILNSQGTASQASFSHIVGGHTHWHRVEWWLDWESGYQQAKMWWAGDQDEISESGLYETINANLTAAPASPPEVWGLGLYNSPAMELGIDDVAIGIGDWIGPIAANVEVPIGNLGIPMG